MYIFPRHSSPINTCLCKNYFKTIFSQISHLFQFLFFFQDESKNHLPTLKKQGLVEAIVEYVSSGSRFKCYIPKTGTIVTFLLSGIKCPKNENDSPLGVEAYKLVKNLIHLMVVHLEVKK